ncbi:hypothetical protein AAF712_014185 [Marasmius tenuissimus]|uniref:Protein kinase domain-containing protein n=1 Tax=Marasmius tenuissimus TaxID=585030 RepID=A0ABR2ZDV5_9AGAR
MANGDIISYLKENSGHDKLQVLSEIAFGLQYLHSLKPPIVHGDIKGANILVDEQRRCLLADFGLADSTADTTRTPAASSGTFRGSIRWMAPEMYSSAMGGAVEENTRESRPKGDKRPRDIYAFACTAVEIMTGKPPFHQFNDAAVIYQVGVLHARPDRPSEGWCPDRIWYLVKQCWGEDPSRRPRAKGLEGFLRSRLVIPGTPSPLAGGFTFVRNHNNLNLNPPPSGSARENPSASASTLDLSGVLRTQTRTSRRIRSYAERIEYPIPPNSSQSRASSSLPSSDGLRAPPSHHGALPSFAPHSYHQPPEPAVQPVQAHNLVGYSRHPALNFDVTLPISMLTSRYQSLSSLLLAEPAVTPALSSLVLITHHLPWSITTFPSNGHYVTVRDMLDAIYHALRKNVSQQEYQSCRDKLRVNEAYQRRYSRIRDYHASRDEKAGGVKRVDFLCGKTRFMGISPTSRQNIWGLRLDFH